MSPLNLRRDRAVFLLVITALLVAVLGALPFATVRAAAGFAEPTFERLDRNRDGFVDRAEGARVGSFGALDANADGRLDRVEFARW
jgi:hypothetical protein